MTRYAFEPFILLHRIPPHLLIVIAVPSLYDIVLKVPASLSIVHSFSKSIMVLLLSP
jgi:hypothetical protein